MKPSMYSIAGCCVLVFAALGWSYQVEDFNCEINREVQNQNSSCADCNNWPGAVAFFPDPENPNDPYWSFDCGTDSQSPFQIDLECYPVCAEGWHNCEPFWNTTCNGWTVCWTGLNCQDTGEHFDYFYPCWNAFADVVQTDVAAEPEEEGCLCP